MNTFISTIGIFILTFIVHVIIHRWFRGIRRDPLISLSVYLPGACLVAWYVIVTGSAYRITSIVLYILLSLTAGVFYLGPYLGGETPASMILASFTKKKRQKEPDLIRLFTESGLFWKRIDDLRRAGLIETHREKYIATSKGRVIIHYISLYKRIFCRPATG